MLIGDNGLLTKTEKATIQTEISKIEEAANLIYQQETIEEIEGNAYDKSLYNIVDQLISKGYEIEYGISKGTEITGISIDRNSISMPTNSKAVINVTYEGTDVGYYAKVKGEYYKIVESSKRILIDREASNIKSIKTPKAQVSSGNSVTIEKPEGVTIIINSGDLLGDSVVTITSGKFVKNCNVSVIQTPTDASTGTNEEPKFSTDYGLIDVIWLYGKTNNVSKTPNNPDLYTNLGDKKLTPVTWSKTTNSEGNEIWEENEIANSKWYDYKPASETQDEKQSMWANAKNVDGSYFVWIPRYAYRITYYSDPEYKNVTGFYDGYGMWNAVDGVLNYKIDEGIETTEYNGNKYIVHPAFEENIDNGGWGSDLTGFWVSKYEMSREGATLDSVGDVKQNIFHSIPNVQSTGFIRIGNMFTYGMQYDREKESHMMKNSEWGAVAYLAHSQYGRNGNQIDYNNSTNCITGNGGGTFRKNDIKVDSIANAYNTIIGAKASTTGNVYGVYDLIGGKNVYVAAFNVYISEERAAWGSSFVGKESTKYATKYENEGGGSTASNIGTMHSKGKIGDAIKEVRRVSAERNWFGDFSEVVTKDDPYFLRGFANVNKNGLYGLFSSWSSTGYENNINGFCVVLGQ